ncbi:hypothetical protein SAY87_009729 [Trapa incisa]|uniref:EF-hand domain-containing protein n=2 Tax=Trapa TaxID=22665 RepID=A0AAN7RD69_TRANT|nr:hypothetical protein SAY87_009729 [Trapa incisa]KAK4798707.1 hypothetical protein SAY86_031033 [Trapa natans]
MVVARLLKNLGGYALGFWQPDELDLCPTYGTVKAVQLSTDDLTVRALRDVFGMEPDGRIKTERARRVVEKLGLMAIQKEDEGLKDEEVRAEEVLGGIRDMTERNRLLKEAFEIFDEDGNGFIEAEELKRVLECLGLDEGWDMGEIEKMVRAVDLNLDGKVDFVEFESMMAMS